MTDYCTMRHLGAHFGVSSHVVGRTLKRLGLRTPTGEPSSWAKEAGLVKMVEGPQPWVPLWLWHEEMTISHLESDGLVLCCPVEAEGEE